MALDADSKLIVSYLVGGRDGEYALAFLEDAASRVQLTSDGHKWYNWIRIHKSLRVTPAIAASLNHPALGLGRDRGPHGRCRAAEQAGALSQARPNLVRGNPTFRRRLVAALRMA